MAHRLPSSGLTMSRYLLNGALSRNGCLPVRYSSALLQTCRPSRLSGQQQPSSCQYFSATHTTRFDLVPGTLVPAATDEQLERQAKLGGKPGQPIRKLQRGRGGRPPGKNSRRERREDWENMNWKEGKMGCFGRTVDEELEHLTKEYGIAEEHAIKLMRKEGGNRMKYFYRVVEQAKSLVLEEGKGEDSVGGGAVDGASGGDEVVSGGEEDLKKLYKMVAKWLQQPLIPIVESSRDSGSDLSTSSSDDTAPTGAADADATDAGATEASGSVAGGSAGAKAEAEPSTGATYETEEEEDNALRVPAALMAELLLYRHRDRISHPAASELLKLIRRGEIRPAGDSAEEGASPLKNAIEERGLWFVPASNEEYWARCAEVIDTREDLYIRSFAPRAADVEDSQTAPGPGDVAAEGQGVEGGEGGEGMEKKKKWWYPEGKLHGLVRMSMKDGWDHKIGWENAVELMRECLAVRVKELQDKEKRGS